MIFWKCWHDLKGRFLLCMALVTVAICPTSIYLAVQHGQDAAALNEQEATADGQDADAAWQAQTFEEFVTQWFQGSEFTITFLTVVLAVGGTMAESQSRSNLLTLSLPVTRRQWLLAQWLTVGALTMSMVLYSALILGAVSVMFGVPIPIGSVVWGFLSLGLWSTVWIGPGMFATSLTRDPVKAATIVVGLLVGLSLVGDTKILSGWSVGRVRLAEAWDGTVPWQSLVVVLFLGLGTLLWSVRRFERTDF